MLFRCKEARIEIIAPPVLLLKRSKGDTIPLFILDRMKYVWNSMVRTKSFMNAMGRMRMTVRMKTLMRMRMTRKKVMSMTEK